MKVSVIEVTTNGAPTVIEVIQDSPPKIIEIEKVVGPKGEPGQDGLSAYELALQEGFVGSLPDWIASLKGEAGRDGTDGRDGIDGTNGINGTDGVDGKDAGVGTVIRLIWDGASYPVKAGPDGALYDFVGPVFPDTLMADGDTWKATE